MKKFVLALVAVLSCTLCANAFVDSQYMTTDQYMQNTGYSAEMSKMMAVVNQDPYREVYTEKHNFKTRVKRIYSYLVPSTYTDLDYYNHNIQLNNPSWKDL